MTRTFLSERRGGVAVVSAVSGGALLAAAALAVDAGSVHLEARRLQGGADLAALAAAGDPRRAEALATQAAADNLGPAVRVLAEAGVYSPDPAKAPASRFAPGGAEPNAARVRVTGEAPLFFGAALLGRKTLAITREAVAARAQWAAFSVGSRLASLDGGVLNGLLSALLGGRVQLSVMDYEALAAADVELLSYVEALRARLDLEAASFEDVLAADAEFGDAYGALGDVLSAQGDARAASAAFALAEAAAGRASLEKLLSLGPYASQDQVHDPHGAGVAVDALDLAEAMAVIAGEGRQVKLDLAAGVPGLLDAEVWLAIGERPNDSPWLTLGAGPEAVVRTAQTRLYVEAQVGGAGLPLVTAPLFAELARAEARLADLDCGGAETSRGVTVDAQPSIGRIALAQIDESRLDDFKQPLKEKPARLANLGLLAVTAQVGIDVGGHESHAIRFTAAEIDADAVKTVRTRDVAEATVASLFDGLKLNLELGGRPAPIVGAALTSLTAPVASVLAAAAPSLDGLLNAVTDVAGVGLGEADVTVHGLVCRAPVLVL